ncbi:hypothetical protein [Nodosilinea nodulosa]|uniref:hypothetical protein n=1 Tax=Nodosilinea nodulosa TaxID=416001 RepID=UPI0002E7DDD1|nr:hypothetical protein [Nodosilinea nodulosa]
MPIKRFEGSNKSERYLKSLCDRTFLSLWGYSGVYSDEGLDRRGQGEEVCDLLVVFENKILIFSDKDCKFPESGTLLTDWKRWFKKSIQKSVKQLRGAEKWIRSRPNKLFLDKKCSQPFPIYLPEKLNFHLIAVAHNSSNRSKREIGGNGSLNIEVPSLQENKEINFEETPFCIGDLDRDKTFIHILDDISLDMTLSVLDTAPDFISYLEKKELLFRSGRRISSPSELDLLAYYHQFITIEDKRDFAIMHEPEGAMQNLILSDECWPRFNHSPDYQIKLEMDSISYQWDALIERLSHHALQESLFFLGQDTLAEQEILIRLLARESRFHRRFLSKLLFELISTAPMDNTVTVRYVPSLTSHDTIYVFLVCSYSQTMIYEEYRVVRKEALYSRCLVAKSRFPEIQHVIGIATENMFLGVEGRSEDLIHVDVTDWTEQDEFQVKKIRQDLKLDQDLKVRVHHDDEYPQFLQ